MDPSLIPTNDIALVALVAIVVQIVKPLAEASFLPADAKVHDPLVRLLSVALGTAVVFVQHGLPDTGAAVLSLISEGATVGLGAIGGFHVLTNSTPFVTVRAPASGQSATTLASAVTVMGGTRPGIPNTVAPPEVAFIAPQPAPEPPHVV